jgi:hypothetical protein
VTKTITLPSPTSEKLEATYSLTGLSKAYIRFGLSPNLLDLMKNGHAHLANETTSDVNGRRRLDLVNNDGTDTVRAFVLAPQINDLATDIGGSTFTTVLRRNQAQTHQVEIELTGAGPHLVTLGFDLGTDIVDSPDSDSDDLLDTWEQEQFGNLDQNATGDPDQDGVSNRNEYLFGSNPNSASSGKPLTSVESISSGFRFSFPTVAGRNYQAQVRNDLTTGEWTNLAQEAIPGDGTTKSVDDLTSETKRFYRVEVTAP